jgi:4'-phosphopantetheinyl transferase EntD
VTPDDLLAAVTPPGAFAALLADTGQELKPHPEEALLTAHAAAKRQREFALGRACARVALARLGHGNAALTRKSDGAPLWPGGIVGSISHTQGLAVALAAPAEAFRGLGVDVEQEGRVVPALYRQLFDSEEQAQLAGMPEAGRDTLAALLFSAKEACCKIWLTRHEALQPFTGIHVTMTGMDFTAQFPARGYIPLRGRTGLGGGMVLAAAWDAV